MITITAQFNILKEDKENYLLLIEELIEKSRLEKGCVQYALFKDKNNQNIFTLIEKWENQNVIDIHNNSDHFITLVPKLAQVNTGDIIVNIYEEINI